MELSKRLQAVADMVTAGSRTADVGCDHGFVSIWLYENKIAPKVYAMDLREGPLKRAREHIEAKGFSDYIETRLSDGVEALAAGEAEALICAGMGGRLMAEILAKGHEKAAAMKELILQPQSELKYFRAFLRQNGFKIVKENMVKEDGKFYPIIKAVHADSAHGEALSAADGAHGEALSAADSAHGEASSADGRSRGEAVSEGGSSCLGAAFADIGSYGEAAFADVLSREMQQRIADSFGPCLLAERHPVLKEYLELLYSRKEKILAKLAGAAGSGEQKPAEAAESGEREPAEAAGSGERDSATSGRTEETESSGKDVHRRMARQNELRRELSDIAYCLALYEA